MLQEIKAAATADGKIDGEYWWEFAHASLEIQLARTRKYLSNGSRTGILFVKDHNRDREAEDEQLPIDSQDQDLISAVAKLQELSSIRQG